MQQLFASQKGFVFTLLTDNADLNISGTTCTVNILKVDGTPIVTGASATALTDGTGATYTTAATDFPVGGPYYIDLHSANGTTTLFKARYAVQVLDVS